MKMNCKENWLKGHNVKGIAKDIYMEKAQCPAKSFICGLKTRIEYKMNRVIRNAQGEKR